MESGQTQDPYRLAKQRVDNADASDNGDADKDVTHDIKVQRRQRGL